MNFPDLPADGETIIRLTHFDTATDRDASTRSVGDPTTGHRRQLRIGWDRSGDNLEADVTLLGASTVPDLHQASVCLAAIAVKLAKDADEIVGSLTDQRFQKMMAVDGPQVDIHDLPAAENGPDTPEAAVDDDVEVVECPGWAGMTDLDRAVALDHIERTGRGELDARIVYVHDKNLTMLDQDMAHIHAMHLESEMSLPHSLTDHERARLREILEHHRETEER